MRPDPVDELREAIAFVARQRTRQILRLAALAMRWYDQALRDQIAYPRTVVATHQMQQHVEAGGRTGGGQDLPCIHVERVRLDAHAWVTFGQLLRIPPMGCHRSAFEDARGCEHEHP